MSSNDNDPVLTVPELAVRWKCTPKSVRLKIKHGELAAFRIGGRTFRVALDEVKRHESGRKAA